METRFLESRDRVRHGRNREAQIANALTKQAGLNLVDATDDEDKMKKVDRWLVNPDGTKTAVQIKYRETGDDLLFEVFDKWAAFGNHPGNKLGRDMQGISKLYAVLRQDRKTVVMVPVAVAKKIVHDMLTAAETVGWTIDNGPQNKTLNFHKAGGKCQLKVQRDPRDGRTKMVAYIPASVFVMESQAEVYRVAMPKQWQD